MSQRDQIRAEELPQSTQDTHETEECPVTFRLAGEISVSDSVIHTRRSNPQSDHLRRLKNYVESKNGLVKRAGVRKYASPGFRKSTFHNHAKKVEEAAASGNSVHLKPKGRTTVFSNVREKQLIAIVAAAAERPSQCLSSRRLLGRAPASSTYSPLFHPMI